MTINRFGCGLAALILVGLVPSGAVGESLQVSTVKVNCRQSPSPRAAVEAQFVRGDRVAVAGRTRYWTRIEGPASCWINSRYLGPVRAVARPALRPAVIEPAASLRRPGGQAAGSPLRGDLR